MKFVVFLGAGAAFALWGVGRLWLAKLAGFALVLTLSFSFKLLPFARPLLATLGFGLLAWAEEKVGGAFPLALYAVGAYAMRFLSAIVSCSCAGLLDFWGFWLGTKAVATGNLASLFTPITMPDGIVHWLGVTGHPASLLMWAPLGLLDIPWAAAVMQMVSLALTGAFVLVLVKNARSPWERVMALWLFMSPNLKTTICGKANLSMVAAPLLGLALYLGFPRVEGVLLALASTFKLPLGLLVLLSPLSKPRVRWKLAWLTLGLLSLVCFLAFGQRILDWLRLMASLSTSQWLNPISYHPAWFLARWGVPHPLLIGYSFSLVLGLTMLVLGARSKGWAEQGGLWASALPYLQNFSWHHHFLFPLFGSWGLLREKPVVGVSLAFFLWNMRSFKAHLPLKTLYFLGALAFSGFLIWAARRK